MDRDLRFQLKKKRLDEHTSDFKRILRLATDNDIAKWKETKLRERQVLIRSRAIARQLNLNLKMSEVEIQADARKATFFYIADERVDFRELIRLYANEFKVKVEMKQIGARQEAGKIGGIGSCGRELAVTFEKSACRAVSFGRIERSSAGNDDRVRVL